MQDAPPAVPIDLSASADPGVASHLPMEERADGTLVIDLAPLAPPPPPPEQCLDTDPNPLDNGILVCRNLTGDQRIDPGLAPADAATAGSAVPRAKFRISEDATGEVNGTNPAVGGWNAQGAEVKVNIDF